MNSMNDEKVIKRSKRIVNILFVISITIIGILIIGLLYLQSLSPVMLFVNDTQNSVSQYLIGGTSPGVRLDVASGDSQLIDMPSWWGTPSFPRNDEGDRVKPRWDLIFFEIYYLSDFPKTWTRLRPN